MIGGMIHDNTHPARNGRKKRNPTKISDPHRTYGSDDHHHDRLYLPYPYGHKRRISTSVIPSSIWRQHCSPRLTRWRRLRSEAGSRTCLQLPCGRQRPSSSRCWSLFPSPADLAGSSRRATQPPASSRTLSRGLAILSPNICCLAQCLRWPPPCQAA